MNNKDYITLYSTFALSETDRGIVFHTLPQREMVACIRPSEISRQRAVRGIGIPVYEHSVHLHDVVCHQKGIQYLHERHLRVWVCREDRSEKIDIHKRMFLIVIVIEHLETGGDRVEVIV